MITISSRSRSRSEHRRPDERLEVLGVADVPGVHDDEAVDEAVLARPRVVARLRRDLVGVDPVRDHHDPLGGAPFATSRALIVSPIETTRSARRR